VVLGGDALTGVILVWRGEFANEDLNLLRREAFPGDCSAHDWRSQVRRHSLGWVCAEFEGVLVGWINVAWDGARHATLLDTSVALSHRHRGIATALVAKAAVEAGQAGCDWLHVDFEAHLAPLYLESCGFSMTSAGLLNLRG